MTWSAFFEGMAEQILDFFDSRTMLDFFEALIRAGAGEKYFENPATLSFVIAPLLRTVKNYY